VHLYALQKQRYSFSLHTHTHTLHFFTVTQKLTLFGPCWTCIDRAVLGNLLVLRVGYWTSAKENKVPYQPEGLRSWNTSRLSRVNPYGKLGIRRTAAAVNANQSLTELPFPPLSIKSAVRNHVFRNKLDLRDKEASQEAHRSGNEEGR
jgi:hypothetical protein